ncbi:MAG: hypothetical protein CMJ20_01495 [Phycisphaeraceae bacterium]|nr:hypothetical protein [Phycisphaeraceae bacterium]
MSEITTKNDVEVMTKSDIVDKVSHRIYDRHRGSKVICESVIDKMLEQIKASVMNEGQTVVFSGIGVFSCNTKGERVGRNPKTGVPSNIPARQKLRFSVTPPFRKRIINQIK